MAAYIDKLEGQTECLGYVVMAPKYGETKKNNLQLAYNLAANGLKVLRFDHTNHVGESEGQMLRYTLPGAVEDILGAYDYLERHHGILQAGLVASSLAGRMAIRATSLDKRINHLTCLVGVVNIQQTLAIVYQEDVVTNYLDGKRWGINDVLGFEIDFENFAAAMIESNLYSYSGTCEDLAAIHVPVSLLSAENDPWVNVEEARHAMSLTPQGDFHKIQNAMHEVRENPEAAQKTFLKITSICLEKSTGRKIQDHQLLAPDKKNLLEQNKVERQRLKASNNETQTEIDFWSQYLAKYKYFQNVDVYQEYINIVGQLLGDFRPGEILLDAGCGNGMFGIWTIRNLLGKEKVIFDPPLIYSGLDLTHEGILEAAKNHNKLSGDLAKSQKLADKGISFIYGSVDFNKASDTSKSLGSPVISYAANTFDKICCSLLISYLEDPSELVRQLFRVLKPGGKLVLSSMKPYCDLSDMYRSYAEKNLSAQSEQDIESGRNLLTAAGKIKFKEELGIYKFYSTEELSELLIDCGFIKLKALSSFGNQANIILAEK
ncbi:hypothetical protein IMCC26134_10295 [Verrucomicrobia bacterium IMCC26134]|nr:hypothetical protein IMCC26134_10295 [Verrucomicrobia bacterium IMCC26134]